MGPGKGWGIQGLPATEHTRVSSSILGGVMWLGLWQSWARREAWGHSEERAEGADDAVKDGELCRYARRDLYLCPHELEGPVWRPSHYKTRVGLGLLKGKKFRGHWVAQWLSICLWLRVWPWGPEIESHIGLPAEGLLLPLPVSLPLSGSLMNK